MFQSLHLVHGLVDRGQGWQWWGSVLWRPWLHGQQLRPTLYCRWCSETIYNGAYVIQSICWLNSVAWYDFVLLEHFATVRWEDGIFQNSWKLSSNELVKQHWIHTWKKLWTQLAASIRWEWAWRFSMCTEKDFAWYWCVAGTQQAWAALCHLTALSSRAMELHLA